MCSWRWVVATRREPSESGVSCKLGSQGAAQGRKGGGGASGRPRGARGAPKGADVMATASSALNPHWGLLDWWIALEVDDEDEILDDIVCQEDTVHEQTGE